MPITGFPDFACGIALAYCGRIRRTERKQAEQALHASEARYRSYIELTGQLAWTANATGEVVEDLPVWRAYTGQSAEEIRGWGWTKALHPDDVAHVTEVWNRAVATKKPTRSSTAYAGTMAKIATSWSWGFR